MNILLDEAVKNLPILYSQEHVDDPIVPCRIYHPFSDWYWYPYEANLDEKDYSSALSGGLKASWDISQLPNSKRLRNKQGFPLLLMRHSRR